MKFKCQNCGEETEVIILTHERMENLESAKKLGLFSIHTKISTAEWKEGFFDLSIFGAHYSQCFVNDCPSISACFEIQKEVVPVLLERIYKEDKDFRIFFDYKYFGTIKEYGFKKLLRDYGGTISFDFIRDSVEKKIYGSRHENFRKEG